MSIFSREFFGKKSRDQKWNLHNFWNLISDYWNLIPDYYAIFGNPEIFSAMAMCICGTLCVLEIFPVLWGYGWIEQWHQTKKKSLHNLDFMQCSHRRDFSNFAQNFAPYYWKIDTFEMCDIFCAGSWDDSIIGLLTIFQLEQRTKDASAFV